MPIGVSVVLLGVSLLFLGISIAIAFVISSNEKKDAEDKISIGNHFPYEVFGPWKGMGIVPRILLIVSFLVVSEWGAMVLGFKSSYFYGDFYYAIFVNVLPILFGASYLVMTSIGLDQEKKHLIFSIISVLLLTLFETALGILFLSLSKYNGYESLSVFAIIFFVLAALCLIASFNPKLKDYAKLEKIEADDGSYSYKRPKVVSLALSEWLMLIPFALSLILIAIAFIIVA